MKRTIILLGCLTCVLYCSDAAQAQRRVPAFRSRSAISPYVNLFQGSNAGLNSYFGVVRPRMAVDQYMRDANNEFQFQQQQIDQRSLQLQQELQDTLSQNTTLLTRPTSGAGGAMRRPAGTFMNYSTYFQRSGTTTMGRSRGGR